jgi:hypothetical protein
MAARQRKPSHEGFLFYRAFMRKNPAWAAAIVNRRLKGFFGPAVLLSKKKQGGCE